MAVVGSSLGGCYAGKAGGRDRLRQARADQPGGAPSRDLAKYIGEQNHWHDPQQDFASPRAHRGTACTIEAFELPHPERCLLVAARGDEVLDWREMVARFPGAAAAGRGSDHALSDFDSAHLDAVIGNSCSRPDASAPAAPDCYSAAHGQRQVTLRLQRMRRQQHALARQMSELQCLEQPGGNRRRTRRCQQEPP